MPAGVAFIVLVSSKTEAGPPRSLTADLAALLALPALRPLALLGFLDYAAIIAFATWAPTRIVDYDGLASQTAALVASVLLVIDVPFAPLWGRAADPFGRSAGPTGCFHRPSARHDARAARARRSVRPRRDTRRVLRVGEIAGAGLAVPLRLKNGLNGRTDAWQKPSISS